MNQNTLTLAIIGHLVGDYLLQNDWMAMNKKKSGFPCVVHCFIWASSVCLFAGWHPLCWLLLFITHFIQDRTQIITWWMRLKWKDQSKFAEPPMAPWSIVVVDNVWHIVTLYLVWRFLN